MSTFLSHRQRLVHRHSKGYLYDLSSFNLDKFLLSTEFITVIPLATVKSLKGDVLSIHS